MISFENVIINNNINKYSDTKLHAKENRLIFILTPRRCNGKLTFVL